MDVKWIKITTDIFDDEKIRLIESLPQADTIITIWFKLLCLAGKQNNCGVFMLKDIPYTDEMFATIFRRELPTVRLALDTLERFEMVKIVDEVYTIPNWEKHQSLDAYEQKKLRDREYQAERRAKQKQLIGEKSSDNRLSSSDNRPLDIDKDKDKEIKDIYREFSSGNEELYKALKDFEKNRAKIKKPIVSDRARQMLVNKLNKLAPNDANTQIKLLDKAIYHDWQDVYEIKEENNNGESRKANSGKFDALNGDGNSY